MQVRLIGKLGEPALGELLLANLRWAKDHSIPNLFSLYGIQGGPVGYTPEYHLSNLDATPKWGNSLNNNNKKRTTKIFL